MTTNALTLIHFSKSSITYRGALIVMKSRFGWLQEYAQILERIAYCKWELHKLWIESERWHSGDLEKMHVTGPKSRPVQIGIESKRVEKELKWNEELRDELLELLNNFEGLDERILKMKYIDHLSLEQISEQVGYSASYVRKRHAELHRQLNFLDKVIEVTLAIQLEE